MISGETTWIHIVLYAAIVAALYYWFMRSGKNRDDPTHAAYTLYVLAASLAVLTWLWQNKLREISNAYNTSARTQPILGGDGEGFR